MELNLKIHVFILVWWERTSELYNLNLSQVSLSSARRWERVVVPIELILISRLTSKQVYYFFLLFRFVFDRSRADSLAYHNQRTLFHSQNLLKRSLFSRLTKIYTHTLPTSKESKTTLTPKQNKQNALVKDFSVYNNRE